MAKQNRRQAQQHTRRGQRVTESIQLSYQRDEYEARQEHEDHVRTATSKREVFTPKTPRQTRLFQSILNNEISVGEGPAGVGKTFTVAAAMAKLLKDGQIHEIVITRANVTVGESIGMLPGTIEEKMAPLLAPILDALKRVLGAGEYEYMLRRGRIKMLPFEYVRGRSFKDTGVIVDEAQNLSRNEVVAICTRYESGRLVILGDPFQNDINSSVVQFGLDPEPTGLEWLSAFNDRNDLGIGVTKFELEDVVRSGFVKRFLTALYTKGH
ncbi:phoH-like protein [Delftia phage PhiW-14]|uniref:PhoH-like protein n=1 Tax=Delftia phage PhiW-14 TaxID=665032 RepID=C9DG49_BPW14|nr:PhoH-like phosphate starvation-inducible [Delftia phage PhiW-14]ACV50100.1 phoH-like protein [Delftia phage PhiW-14]